MIAGTLEIQMAMNLARLADDMTKSKNIVGGAMKDIEGAVAGAKSMLRDLGIGFGIGYFVSLIKGSIDASAHLEDLNKSTGISVENLAGLRLIAKESGGDIDSMALSINRLAVNMGKTPEAFRALGVSSKDPLQAFKQLSDIFLKLGDPDQRAAVMAQALGKAWFGAAPALAMGSEKISEMIEKGTRLSNITEENVRQSKELHDKWIELVGTGGTLTGILSNMLGPLLSLTNQMIAAKEGASGFWDGLSRFFSISGDQAKNPEAALAAIIDKLATLRKTEEEFAGMNLFKRIFSADDIAIVRLQIDSLEKQRSVLQAMMGAPFPGKVAPTAGAKADAAAAAARFLAPKADKHLWDEYVKGLKEVVAVEEQANKAQTDFNEANSIALQDSKFQLELVGKTAFEIQKLTEIRKLDLAGKVAEGKVNSELSPDQFRAIAEETKNATKLMLDMMDARRKAERDWATGTKTAFDQYVDHATNAAEQAAMLYTNAFKNMEDALVEFVRTGKIDFRSLADSIISDLIRIQIRQALAGFAGSSIGIALGLGSGGGGPELLGGPGFVPSGHTGGIVGSDIFTTRHDIPSWSLAGIPRYHSGLASDERLGIFQTGERIIPRGGSTGGPVFNQVFNVGGNVTQADLAATAAAARRGTLTALAEERRRDPSGPFGG